MEKNRKDLTQDEKVDSKSPEDTASTGDTESKDDQVVTEQKESDPQIQKNKQVLTWKKRIDMGDADLEDAPLWVSKEIEKLKKNESNTNRNEIRKILHEEERLKDFHEMKKKVLDSPITSEQAKSIDDTFDSLMESGKYDQLEALEYALFKNNVKVDVKPRFESGLNLAGSLPAKFQDAEKKDPEAEKKDLYKEVYG